MKDKQKLDGKALSSSMTMAMLEFMNGGPEIGKLSPDHPAMINARALHAKNQKIGKVMVFSTVGDMNKDGGGKLLWEE